MIAKLFPKNLNSFKVEKVKCMTHKRTFWFCNPLSYVVHAAPPLVLRTQPNVGKTLELRVSAVASSLLLRRQLLLLFWEGVGTQLLLRAGIKCWSFKPKFSKNWANLTFSLIVWKLRHWFKLKNWPKLGILCSLGVRLGVTLTRNRFQVWDFKRLYGIASRPFG